MATTGRIFCFVFVMMVLLGCCSAKIYKVGGSEGWTTKTAREDVFNDWFRADHKVYLVGDSLIFEYDPKINDVTQVSGSLEYEFCDSSSPKVVYNTGHDVVTFTEPGFYYFISSNQPQCVSGQRYTVLVVHDPSSPVPPPTLRKILPIGKMYKVGDSKGWSVYNSDFLHRWSEEKQFHVGDILLFEYDNEINNVYEISGDLEFLTCDPESPVAVHKTGHDLVRLTETGVHYFVTSRSGYCEAGLKLRVVVGPLPKPVTLPNFPKKMDLSAMERLNNWLQSFRPQPHH